MKDFTEADIKEMVRFLNRRYSGNEGSITGIVEEIDDYAYEHEFINDIKVEGELCEREEIERDYWEYCGVDAVSEEDYDKNYYIIDISYEDGAICVYVSPAPKSDYDAYWDKYAWEENNYDKYEDD